MRRMTCGRCSSGITRERSSYASSTLSHIPSSRGGSVAISASGSRIATVHIEELRSVRPGNGDDVGHRLDDLPEGRPLEDRELRHVGDRRRPERREVATHELCGCGCFVIGGNRAGQEGRASAERPGVGRRSVPEGADDAQRRPESGRVVGLGNELGEHLFDVGVVVRFGHHRRQPLEELVDPLPQ